MHRFLLIASFVVLGSASCNEEEARCTRKVTVTATFWAQSCWAEGVWCDGEQVASGENTCDNDRITCDAPAIETYVMEFTSAVGASCEVRVGEGIAELDPTCNDQAVSVTASGSEEEGPQPMVDTCDAVEQD